MGAPWKNSQNNIEKNMRFQCNFMEGLTRLLSLRKYFSMGTKRKIKVLSRIPMMVGSTTGIGIRIHSWIAVGVTSRPISLCHYLLIEGDEWK
jgi:hypothetical protein